MPFLEMNEKTFKARISYTGEKFSGWQVQPEKRTVQGVLLEVLSKLFKGKVKVIAAGRTDTGVHALNQIIKIRGETSLDPSVLKKALNSLLPRDIRVLEIEAVDKSFNPLRNRGKIYAYFIYTGEIISPFLSSYFYHLKRSLDYEILSLSAEIVKGIHDFSAFRNRGSNVKGTKRNVFISEWLRSGDFWVYVIGADGFLKQMVRVIVGTMLDLSMGKIDISYFENLLRGEKRERAGKTAPPHGLFLLKVFYEEDPIKWWEERKVKFMEFLELLKELLC
jgi:tRNA pseudouridine38-40 synthase